MAVVRHDVLDEMDQEQVQALLHQLISLYEEEDPNFFGERVESLLITMGLITYEDIDDAEKDLV